MTEQQLAEIWSHYSSKTEHTAKDDVTALLAEVHRLQAIIDDCQWTACDDGSRKMPPTRRCRAACAFCSADFERGYEHEDDCPVLKRRLPEPIMRRRVRVAK